MVEKEQIIKEYLTERNEAIQRVAGVFKDAVLQEGLTIGEQCFLVESFKMDFIYLLLQKNLKNIDKDAINKAKDLLGI